MMKFLVLCLIVHTSLASAGFFTPTPEKMDDVTDKEGVVINTKVTVSPEEVNNNIDEKGHVITNAKEKLSQKMEETKEKMKESTSSLLPDQDILTDMSSKAKEKVGRLKEGAKQQVFDTIGAARGEAERRAEEVKKGGEKVFLRRGSEVFKRLAAKRMSLLANVLHLLGFAAAYGMCVWVTFASSYVMAGALPRNQFAMVQSKIYPVYFKAMAGCVGLALLGYSMSRVRKGVFGGLDLVASLAMILVNLFYLEPKTTKVMFERMKKEKEEGQVTESAKHEVATEEKREEAKAAPAAAKPRIVRRIVRTREILMRRLNSNSSLLNVVTLLTLTWHLVQLAQNLHRVS